MNSFLKALVFAVAVTLGMNALDMTFHVATDTAVHLNYVAVKFTIVFAAVFLIAWLVGIGRTQGIVTALLGPVAFYIYYRVASATIDHSLFRIDDAVWYICIHAIALGIMYFLGSRVIKKGDSLSFAAFCGLASLALHWGWIMFVIKWTGGTDEATMLAMTLNAAIIAFVFLFVLIYAMSWTKSLWIGSIGVGIVFAAASLLLGATPIGGVARVLVSAGPFWFVHKFLRAHHG
jgi:uncharacterized membrane protein